MTSTNHFWSSTADNDQLHRGLDCAAVEHWSTTSSVRRRLQACVSWTAWRITSAAVAKHSYLVRLSFMALPGTGQPKHYGRKHVALRPEKVTRYKVPSWRRVRRGSLRSRCDTGDASPSAAKLMTSSTPVARSRLR